MAPSRKKQPGARSCIACGKQGHRLETCDSWAGREIRKLRAALGQRRRDGANNRRARPGRKRGPDRKEAAARTSVKKQEDDKSWLPHNDRVQQALRCQCQWHQLLQSAGFLHRPLRCLACGSKGLEKMQEMDQHLTVRRRKRTCRTRNSKFSVQLRPFSWHQVHSAEAAFHSAPVHRGQAHSCAECERHCPSSRRTWPAPCFTSRPPPARVSLRRSSSVAMWKDCFVRPCLGLTC